MSTLRVIGVMTGTSCDGLDASCLEIGARGWRVAWNASRPYPAKLRARVLAIQEPGTRVTLKEMMRLHRDLGDWYGTVLSRMLESRARVDLIANHGQTVGHFPDARSRGSTLQLGDPAHITARTGISVASNFRDGDMAAGGQGAPLVPLFHRLLAAKLACPGEGIAIHNLGGISNLTYVHGRSKLLAFDTGPGNSWIDAAAELSSQGRLKMDRAGKLARAGKVDINAVTRILSLPYFRKAPPKSTGRDDFPFSLLRQNCRAQGNDLVATATYITIESVVRAYQRWILDRQLPLNAIYICGGGAKNPNLIKGISELLPEVKVKSLSETGFDAQYTEAQAFALFGYLTLRGQALGGAWTGAKTFGTPAHLLPGKNWRTLIARAAAFKSDPFGLI